jgi:hypothetical protein
MATKSEKPAEKTKSVTSKKTAKSPKSAAEKVIKKTPVKKADTAKAPTPRKKRAVKTTASKAVASISLDPKPIIQAPVIPHDEISLRAYFIAERRHKMGWPGDSATDWADAVKQLTAEALEKPLKKR